MKEEAEESKKAWVDGLTRTVMDGLCKTVGMGLNTYTSHVREQVGIMYDQQQSAVEEMGTVLGRRIGRLEEELAELRAMVKRPNVKTDHDDCEGSEWGSPEC